MVVVRGPLPTRLPAWRPVGSLYQMAPNGLQLFAVNNVRLQVWDVEVAPQWVQNINTVCIVIGGPLLAALFAR